MKERHEEAIRCGTHIAYWGNFIPQSLHKTFDIIQYVS